MAAKKGGMPLKDAGAAKGNPFAKGGAKKGDAKKGGKPFEKGKGPKKK